MKIGIVSDTRAGSGEEIPQEVARALEGVDRIFHAGGIHSKEVLDWLEQIAPVTAAARLEGGQAEQPQPFMLEVPGDPRVAETPDPGAGGPDHWNDQRDLAAKAQRRGHARGHWPTAAA